MDENKLKAIVKEVVDEAVEPIKLDLVSVKTDLNDLKIDVSSVKTDLNDLKIDVSSVKTDLVEVKDIVENRLHPALITIETTIKGYGDMYKVNDSNIRKMEKRLETLEEDSGVDVPQEFQLADVA